MGEVVVLGSLNMDLVVRTAHIPHPGETVHGTDFVTVPGGKGANQAAAAARLGAQVAMLGRVGADAFGEAMLANLRAQGVETTYIQHDPAAPSGTALITVDAQGENTIVVAPGANGQVNLGDMKRARPLLAQAYLLIMQFEIPLEVVRAAIRLAVELGVRVILNPAPAYRVEPSFLQGVYCLVVNETEAQALTDVIVDSPATAEHAARALRALGASIAIVTLGAQGALVVSEAEALHVPARRVTVVDTTAAGDAFIGGLAAAFLRDLPLAQAVRYATCAGTLATTVLGAQTSLPTAAQVDAFFQQGAS